MSAPAARRAWILGTGDEIVRGRSLDTNSSEIARALAAEGIRTEGATLVPDDEDRLVEEILRAAQRADLIVLTGGLGPTADDCTRGAAARAAGTELERVPQLEAAVRERFARRGVPMPESNLVQADRPRGATTFMNRHGTAPGFVVAVGAAHLAALPGPPHEMRGVLAEELLPWIRGSGLCGDVVVRSRAIETFGEPEARVGEAIADLMRRDRTPRVGTTAARGTIRVVIHADGPRDAVDAAIAADEAEIRRRLGAAVFGSDGETLELVVARALIARGRTLAVAESLTGGLVASWLTRIPGVSAVLQGSVVAYARDAKTSLLGLAPESVEGARVYDEATGRAMAQAVRIRLGADYGIATTGVAGPGDDEGVAAGTVVVAVADADSCESRRFVFRGDRDLVRDIAAKSALDLLRRRLSV